MKFLIGLLLGIGIATGAAYYLSKSQSPFTEKTTKIAEDGIANIKNPSSSNPMILAPGTKMQEASSAPIANKPAASAQTYDFYDVLQGKKGLNSSQPVAQANPVVKKPTASKAAILSSPTPSPTTTNGSGNYIIQAGAFANPDSANDLKAHLALLGFSARITNKQENDKMINKVVLGPFNSSSQAQNVKAQLQQQDINVTIINLNQ
jgi:cell division protein FtsN